MVLSEITYLIREIDRNQGVRVSVKVARVRTQNQGWLMREMKAGVIVSRNSYGALVCLSLIATRMQPKRGGVPCADGGGGGVVRARHRLLSRW